MSPQQPTSNLPGQPLQPTPPQPQYNQNYQNYYQTAYQQPTQPTPPPTVSYSQQLPTPTMPQSTPQTPTPVQSTPTPQSPKLPDTTLATSPTAIPPHPADNPNSTQATLLISELRDGLVIMKDGSFRAVVACKSINFDLMSSNEREGVEYSYQNFINSLDFPTQILVRSQRVDIGPYLERLTTIRKNNDNMLLGVLMDDYINFVDVLSQEANIMDKSFFIIIPYYTSEDAEKLTDQAKNIFTAIGKKASSPGVTKIDRATYDKAVSEMNNRVESVISGLFQIGIHSVRLNTSELSKLYYSFNNPDTAVREPFVDFSKLATTYVRKEPNPLPTNQGGQNA